MIAGLAFREVAYAGLELSLEILDQDIDEYATGGQIVLQ